MTNPNPESSSTHSHSPRPCMRKISLSKQNLLFSKIHYRSVGKKMGLPSEANVLENFLKQSRSSSEMICWTISQPYSPKIHPVKFPLKNMFVFLKTRYMHSHLTSRLPSAYGMHYDAIQHNIYNTCYYIKHVNIIT